MPVGVDKTIEAVNNMQLTNAQVHDLKVTLNKLSDPFDEGYQVRLRNFFTKYHQEESYD